MMLAEGLQFLLFHFLFPPIFLLFVISLVLASFGKSLGIRKRYVERLLHVFEYGRIKIEKAEQKRWKPDDDDISAELPDESNGSTTVISREGMHLVPDPEKQNLPIPRNRSFDTFKREFQLSDAMDFVKAGVEAIIEDEVTQRFSAEGHLLLELPSWNLLTRTNRNYHYISMKLTFVWVLGWIFRYSILLPMRLILMVLGVGWLCLCTGCIGYLPDGRAKRWLNTHVSLMCFRILSRAFSAMITYHDRENRAKGGGICVANHTSPIDVVILACDNCYALIGQSHEGFLGLLQRALARAGDHIWFERSEIKDRYAVSRRLKEHVDDASKWPILIFPEGTCINNTSVMMFKKGSFEIGGVIYPVAIKYDSKFGDPFWNSSKFSMMQYLLMMMTSWAIVCDVWYLPPMTLMPDEDAVDFADRVKAAIARKGGLVDLMWDGQLKRINAKLEWKEKQQEEYSRRLVLDQSPE
uniref:Phospholipid/glycerol acyltransferase domain-containing protein n=1 Tax=Strigamia maritima TaxID=126957 RepID=T1IW46_STRMM